MDEKRNKKDFSENGLDLEANDSSTTQLGNHEHHQIRQNTVTSSSTLHSSSETRESTTQTDLNFHRENPRRVERHERYATEDDDCESVSSTATVIFMADRLMHVTWAWYMMTMSTGGTAVLLGNQAHTFKGLQTIGKIVFIFDIILFVCISIGLIQRFARKPSLFLRSLRNPGEFLFAPALFITLCHLQLCMDAYAEPATGPWIRTALRVLFWIYTAFAFLMAVGVYLDLFTARRLTDKDITPAWVLPILPIMLVGTIAGTMDKDQPLDQRMDIFLAGLTFQGLGFWVAISLYGPVMSRLMRIGLPKPSMRPGMFIAVAPPAYTSLSLIKLSNAFGESLNLSTDQKYPQAAEIVHYIGLIWAILIWSLAFWWFCIALTSVLLEVRKIKFTLVWYSAIFPNVGLTLATINIGQSLNSNAITWVGSGMTIVIVAAYLFILVNHCIAIYQREILWPGKDDDKET